MFLQNFLRKSNILPATVEARSGYGTPVSMAKHGVILLTHADLVKNSLSAVLTSGGAANLKCFGMTAKAANMAIPMAIPLRQVKAILVHT